MNWMFGLAYLQSRIVGGDGLARFIVFTYELPLTMSVGALQAVYEFWVYPLPKNIVLNVPNTSFD